MKTRMLYLDPNSAQTLREAVAEIRAAETPDTDAAQTFAPELLAEIDMHDAIHALFACRTNLAGEIIAHVWTLFGTTAKISDMHRVNRHHDHRKVLKQIGHLKVIGTWFCLLPEIIRTIFATMQMTRRWPVDELDDYLDKPLRDIRHELCVPVRSR